jgi:hypothetical protein
MREGEIGRNNNCRQVLVLRGSLEKTETDINVVVGSLAAPFISLSQQSQHPADTQIPTRIQDTFQVAGKGVTQKN